MYRPKKDLVACREIMDFAYDSLKETLKKNYKKISYQV